MVAAAIAGAGALSGIAGGIIQGGAAGQASADQQAAEKRAIQAAQNYFGQAEGFEQPFVNFGTQAGGQLSALLGLNGGGAQAQQTLQNLPGYQFTLAQGQQANNNSITARGLGLSGAQLRGATNYAEGAASQNYSNYANELLSFTSLGANTAQALGNQAINTGNTIAGANVGIGNAQAAGAIGQGNALAGIFGGIGNAGSQYGGLNLYQSLLAQNSAQGGQFGLSSQEGGNYGPPQQISSATIGGADPALNPAVQSPGFFNSISPITAVNPGGF